MEQYGIEARQNALDKESEGGLTMNSIRRIFAVLLAATLFACGAATAEEGATATAHDFLGEWVDEDGTTNINIEAREEGDGYVVNIYMDVFDGEDYSYNVWAYGCLYDEAAREMKSISRVTGSGDYEPDSKEEISDIDFEYADAAFRFDDAGMLIWDDGNESADDGMAFEHTIGWIDPDYVGPGRHFVGEWNAERVSITIDETMENYQVIVSGSNGASEGTFWLYTCDYDAETDSLISNGEVATKYDYSYDDAGEYSEEIIYEDGAATFSLNGEDQLIWDDKKENAGEDRVFEYAGAEEEALNTVAPMDPGYDLDALADGTYPAGFAPSDLADGALTFYVYSEDIYDIVDIDRIAEGDSFVVGGLDFEVESVERGEDLLINGGLDNGGFTLSAFDGDNGWKVVMENDHNTYTNRGETTLPLDGGATFTDGWDIEKEPVTVSGADAVAESITGTEMDYFSPLNTTVRVEGGRIVEIIRAYMP